LSDYIEVFITIDSRKGALKLADVLLKDKAAACVQVGGPVKSFYWWKGKMEKKSEWTLTLKTRAGLLAMIERSVRKNHPYEVPEIISKEIAGTADYLEWINNITGDKR
jgi:periplasmic divalent cation tolerance protein